MQLRRAVPHQHSRTLFAGKLPKLGQGKQHKHEHLHICIYRFIFMNIYICVNMVYMMHLGRACGAQAVVFVGHVWLGVQKAVVPPGDTFLGLLRLHVFQSLGQKQRFDGTWGAASLYGRKSRSILHVSCLFQKMLKPTEYQPSSWSMK